MAKQTKKKKAVGFRKREGFRLKGDALKIGKRLAKLEGPGGELSPVVIVEDARDPKSPLHGEFEWDDTEAAHQYRLDQARYIFRAVEMVWEEEEVEIVAPSFVSVAVDTETPYRNIRNVLTDQNLRRDWKAQALRDLRSWRERYAHIKELSDVFEVVDKIT